MRGRSEKKEKNRTWTKPSSFTDSKFKPFSSWYVQKKNQKGNPPPESESIRLHQGLRNQNKGKLRSGKRGGSMKGQTLVYKFAFASVTQ